MNTSNSSPASPEGTIINHPPKRIRLTKIVVLLVILIACATYPILKIRWAHRQVESFCTHIAIGMPVQGLEAKARELGLEAKVFKAAGSRPSNIIVWSGWAFARWFCEVEYANGKVVSKDISFLD